MLEGLPNMVMINEENEDPNEMIEDYVEIINEVFKNKNALTYVLWEFFNDVNYWTLRQVFIDQAKINIGRLQQLDELEQEFIEDDFDEFE